MSELGLILESVDVNPGGTIKGELQLFIDDKTRARGLTVRLHGSEKTEIDEYDAALDTRTTKEEKRIIVDETRSYLNKVSGSQGDGHKDLTIGDYKIPFEFTLPADATPSYRGEHAKVEYFLEAKLDIPRGFDLNDATGLAVRAAKWQGQKERAEIPPEGELDFAVELDSETVARGGTVGGFVKYSINTGKRAHVREVRVKMRAVEHAVAGSRESDSTRLTLRAYHQPTVARAFESDFRFSIGLPENMYPTIEGEYFSLRWILEVDADIGGAPDVHIQKEIMVR